MRIKISEMRYCEASLWDKPWGEVRYAWKDSDPEIIPSAYALTRQTFTDQYSYADDPSTAGVESFGLMFYQSRFYDPSLGRFASADSIVPTSQGTQGLDRYAYVNNNPVRYTDPTGHAWDDCEGISGGYKCQVHMKHAGPAIAEGKFIAAAKKLGIIITGGCNGSRSNCDWQVAWKPSDDETPNGLLRDLLLSLDDISNDDLVKQELISLASLPNWILSIVFGVEQTNETRQYSNFEQNLDNGVRYVDDFKKNHPNEYLSLRFVFNVEAGKHGKSPTSSSYGGTLTIGSFQVNSNFRDPNAITVNLTNDDALMVADIYFGYYANR